MLSTSPLVLLALAGRAARGSVQGRSSSCLPALPPYKANYTFLGCFTDYVNGNTRTLGEYSVTSQSMTPQSCMDVCGQGGFSYGGVEFADQCFCGNTIIVQQGSGVQVNNSECATACAGNSSEVCGGGDR